MEPPQQKEKRKTTPIPDPPSSRNNDRRTYTIEQLLSRRDEFQGDVEFKLPDRINRNLLETSLRKRKYPFITESQRRKAGESGTSSRWEGKQGGSKWRHGKGRKDAASIDEIEEVEEHDETRNMDEPDPDWADVDEDTIKRDIKNFQFQALDREAEREMFARTGEVPDEPKLVKAEKPEKSEEKNLVDSLFLSATASAMPQLPENAVDANQLEKNPTSIFTNGQEKGRSEDEPVRTLGLFDFSEFQRNAGQNGVSPDMKGFAGQQDLRTQELNRPMGNSAHHRDYLGIGDRSQTRESPSQSASMPEDPSRVPDYSPGSNQRHGDVSAPSGQEDNPAHNSVEQSAANQHVEHPKAAPPVKGNGDPVQRLDNILYDVTDPVRPCVGGQFFAPARPLTNKELYDYSPKFKEIQDTRHKQMLRHSMQVQRKRMMMAKYAQAKQMYEKYPPHQMRKYGVPPQENPHSRSAMMEDYQRRREYDYMKSAGSGRVRGPPMPDPYH